MNNKDSIQSIKEKAYRELAIPAMQNIIRGILHLAEAEAYLGEDGYYSFPPYWKERLDKLKEILMHIKEPETPLEQEQFIGCFDSNDFEEILTSESRYLPSWIIGAAIYEKSQNRRIGKK